MNQKKSKYNFEYRRNKDENIIYNTYSKALISLTDKEYDKFLSLSIDEDMRKNLIENGILVNENFDELQFLKYMHYKTKFSRRVLHLTIAPTLNCNFDCPYCYENRREGKMSTEVQNALIDFVSQSIDEGVKLVDIAWYGGEPLLCVDVVENLSRKLKDITLKKDCTLKMYMVTNGYLLTPEIVRLLDDIGISRIQITLDGLDENHNKRRPLRGGGSTFDKIVENLKLFEDYPIDVIIRMNVDNINQSDYIGLKNLISGLDNPNITLYPSPVEDINKDKENNVSDFMSSNEFDEFTVDSCNKGALKEEGFDVVDDRFCFCAGETEMCYVVDSTGDFYKCWDEIGRKENCCFNILKPTDKNYSVILRYLMNGPFEDERCTDCIYLPICFGGCKFQKKIKDKLICGFNEDILKNYIETNFFKN